MRIKAKHSSNNLFLLKDTYIVIFPNSRIAEFWRTKFALAYGDKIVTYRRPIGLVELDDQAWYFKSEQCVSDIKAVRGTILPGESICIILDDPERKRLETFEEGEGLR